MEWQVKVPLPHCLISTLPGHCIHNLDITQKWSASRQLSLEAPWPPPAPPHTRLNVPHSHSGGQKSIVGNTTTTCWPCSLAPHLEKRIYIYTWLILNHYRNTPASISYKPLEKVILYLLHNNNRIKSLIFMCPIHNLLELAVNATVQPRQCTLFRCVLFNKATFTKDGTTTKWYLLSWLLDKSHSREALVQHAFFVNIWCGSLQH
jgi:hypothetical protein